MGATLVAGDVLGSWQGYYPAIGVGSLTPSTIGGFATKTLVTGLTAGRINVGVTGDATTYFTGKSIYIDGTPYALVSGPTYDGGADDTTCEYTYGPGNFVVSSSYDVDFASAAGSQTLTPSLFTNSNSFFAPTVTGGASYEGPTYIGKSTVLASSAAGTINFTSSGRVSGDKLFIAVATANEAIATPTGFTQTASSPQFRGTAALAGGIRLAVFEKTSDGAETTVSIADSGNHQYAVGIVVRKASGSSLSIDATAGNNVAAATSCTFGGVTTTTDDCMVLTFVGTDRDSAGPSFSAEANASLTGLSERHDAGTTTGVGSGIAIYTGEKWTSGATGNTTATQAASAAYCWITIAVKNEGSQTLTAPLFSNANSFYAPTVTRGAVTLTPSLFSNSNIFHAATVTQPAASQDLTPSLFTNSNSFYAPTVAAGAVTLSPPLFTSTNAFYGPTVTAGAVTLTPSLFSASNSFYGPTITTGAVTLSLGLFSATNNFYAATVSVGAVTLSPPLFSNSNSFYSPTVTQNAVSQSLTPSLFTNTNSFYSPTVAPQGVILTPSLFANNNTFFAPTVALAATELFAPFHANDNSFYAPTVSALAALTGWQAVPAVPQSWQAQGYGSAVWASTGRGATNWQGVAASNGEWEDTDGIEPTWLH